MSYILDALKRSEQERHQGELNHATIDTIMIPRRQKHHHWWPYVLILVLVLNLGVYLYFQFSGGDQEEPAPPQEISNIESVNPERLRDLESVRNKSSERPDTDLIQDPSFTEKNAAKERAIPEHLLKTPHLTKRFDINTLTAEKTVRESGESIRLDLNSDGLEVIRPKTTTKSILPSAEMINAYNQTKDIPQTVDAEIISPSNTKKTMPIPIEEKVVENFDSIDHLNDLDDAFKRSVPDIRFNSHIYSVIPTDRRVMINDLYLREGQSFSGMQIKTIGEFYLVLSKGDLVFKIPVLRDWFRPD